MFFFDVMRIKRNMILHYIELFWFGIFIGKIFMVELGVKNGELAFFRLFAIDIGRTSREIKGVFEDGLTGVSQTGVQ